MSMESDATPAPAANAPKPRAKVIRWLEDSPTPMGDWKSQAGNAKFGRLAELQGKSAPVTLRVIGVQAQWAAHDPDEVELYRTGDGGWGAQPALRRDAVAPADAF